MKKYVVKYEAFSNSGKQSYGIRYLYIISDNEKIIEIMGKKNIDFPHRSNNPFSKKYIILETSHNSKEIPLNYELFRNRIFLINPELLNLPEVIDNFNYLEKKLKAEDSIQSIKNEIEEKIKDGFRLWLKFTNGEKARIDKYKLIIYKAKTMPNYLKGKDLSNDNHSSEYEKRINSPKLHWKNKDSLDIVSDSEITYSVEKILFQKKIKKHHTDKTSPGMAGN